MNPFFDAAACSGIIIIVGAATAYTADLISPTFVYTVTVSVCAGMGIAACLSDRGMHGFFAKGKVAEESQTLARVEAKVVK